MADTYTNQTTTVVRQKLKYVDTIRWAKRCQVVLAVVLAFIIAATPELRSKLESKPVELVLVNLSFEVILFGLMSWIFGMNKIPANFTSLMFLRLFVFTANDNEAELAKASLRNVGAEGVNEAWYSQWISPSVLNPWNTSTTEESCCSRGRKDRVNTEKFIFSVLIFFLTALSASYSKVDISKCENLAIILTSFGTSLSTVVLITSLTVGRFGSERHLLLCQFWILYTFVAALFTFVYATQRMFRRVRGKFKSSAKYHRTQMELVIFAINVCTVVYYMPLIHPGLSVYETVVSFPYDVVRLGPQVAQRFLKCISSNISPE